jgi:hypothetical protein
VVYDVISGHKINGSVFLQLPNAGEALKEFGLSYGFKAHLPEIVKKVTF